jgi:osmoprotectant transport system substrate-binding protein
VPPAGESVVVASFDFPESELLAEIYAQALSEAGVPVRRELRLGPREVVLPALRQGHVDAVPEYLGSALSAVGAPLGPGADVDEAHQRLVAVLRRDGLRALRPAPAHNQNALVVTRTTAERLDLRTTSDLVPHGPGLVLAGPPECPRREYCLPGLRSAYGLSFGRFVPYARVTQRLTALDENLVDVAVAFVTDATVATGDLVLLPDDRGLQPPENVVPVVSDRAVERHGDLLVNALDGVSARLDLPGLRFLNWRVEVAGGTAEEEARGWLLRQGLLPR